MPLYTYSMTKIISTKLSDEEYLDLLKICRMTKFSSEDILRELVLGFLHGRDAELIERVNQLSTIRKLNDATIYDRRGKLVLEPEESLNKDIINETDTSYSEKKETA